MQMAMIRGRERLVYKMKEEEEGIDLGINKVKNK